MSHRPGTRPAIAAGLLLAASLHAQPASGQTIDTTAMVLVSGHADPRDGKIYTVVPIYEQLTVGASDFKLRHLEDFKVLLQGWSMQSIGQPAPDVNFDVARPFPNGTAGSGNAIADFDLGFVEGKLLRRHVTFRLGRQFVTGGAARITQLDGLYLDVRIVRGFGISAYGGVPVTPRLGFNRGDGAVGGRVYYRFNFQSELGVSAIDVIGDGRAVRQDVSADLRWGIHRTFYLTGYGLFSIRELRLAEANASLNWQPLRSVLVSADWRRVAPDLFLPLNSIFSVFSQETRDEAGASIFYQPVLQLKLSGDYRFVNDANGLGHRGGLKAIVMLGKAASVGLEGRVLHLTSNGYWQARVFATERTGNFFFSLDLDGYYLESPINRQNLSYTTAATAGWDFARGWKLALTGLADVTPFVDRRFEFIARLVWNQTVRIHEVR